MTTDYNFEGWLGKDESSAEGKMQWGEFEPKKWDEDDVDIKISHCGVCGSDIHTLKSGWGPTPYPCVVGHEIVGKAVKVGKNVKHVKVGDRVGVGAQSDSCGECNNCKSGLENYCPKMVQTYAIPYNKPKEGISKGGYATYNRAPSHFVFHIPKGLDSADAAPMLCGGVTVYSPLKQNGCGPGKRVGIVGVGGLGHFAVLFAKALGADEVVGISRKASKKEQVLKLGADRYIATDDDKDWVEKNAKSLDLIISTVSSAKMPLEGYLSLLATKGTYMQIGIPDGGELPAITAPALIYGNIKIGGSLIGAPIEIEEMLQLAADKKIKPWIEERPMKDANQAIIDFNEGKPRYRYVLVNEH